MRKKTFVPLLPDAVAMGHIGYGTFGAHSLPNPAFFEVLAINNHSRLD